MNPLEPCYEIASRIYRMAVTVLNASCCVFWVKPAMAGRKKLWRIGAAYVTVILILAWVPCYIPSILVYGLGVLAAFLVMCLLDRKDFGQKVFLAVTFFCMRWQAGNIVGSTTGWLYRGWVDWLISLKGQKSWTLLYKMAMESYEFWFAIYVADCIFGFLLTALLLYGAIRLMRWAYGGGQGHLNRKELLLLLMPSVLGVFAYGVDEFYRGVYEAEAAKSVFDLKGRPLLINLYCLACYFTILAMVYVFRKWKQEQRADGERRVFLAQMKDVQRHMEEVERLYSDLRGLRHDMGNHLMTLEELYARGAYEAAGRYAEDMRAKLQAISADIRSGHPVTDALLSVRRREMEEKGISFDCDFHYPQKGELNAFDLSIILNNALANAVEASEGEPRREITLTSRLVKSMYIIEVANAFSGSLHIDVPDGLPLTTKTEEGHGFGLSGIRHVARSYYGEAEIGVEQYRGIRCCVLRVMLQIG